MNLILLTDPDFISPDRVRLTDRRLVHIREILKAECSDRLTVGKLNGLMGQGTVVTKTKDLIELDVKLDTNPPRALPLTLILALPRPPMLKRILFSAAMLGVKKIIILNFKRVEKSLWNSSSLQPAAITEQLILGLEQAKDTMMPEIILRKGFKPFVQDELPAFIKENPVLVAHPGSGIKVTDVFNKSLTIIIGPEGGIIDYEIELLKAAGCQTIDLGPRILRAETVLPYVVGKLYGIL